MGIKSSKITKTYSFSNEHCIMITFSLLKTQQLKPYSPTHRRAWVSESRTLESYSLHRAWGSLSSWGSYCPPWGSGRVLPQDDVIPVYSYHCIGRRNNMMRLEPCLCMVSIYCIKVGTNYEHTQIN